VLAQNQDVVEIAPSTGVRGDPGREEDGPEREQRAQRPHVPRAPLRVDGPPAHSNQDPHAPGDRGDRRETQDDRAGRPLGTRPRELVAHPPDVVPGRHDRRDAGRNDRRREHARGHKPFPTDLGQSYAGGIHRAIMRSRSVGRSEKARSLRAREIGHGDPAFLTLLSNQRRPDRLDEVLDATAGCGGQDVEISLSERDRVAHGLVTEDEHIANESVEDAGLGAPETPHPLDIDPDRGPPLDPP